jgi:hypothetical protein
MSLNIRPNFNFNFKVQQLKVRRHSRFKFLLDEVARSAGALRCLATPKTPHVFENRMYPHLPRPWL